MKKNILLLTIIFFSICLFGIEYVPNELIVKTNEPKSIHRGKLGISAFDEFLVSKRMKSIKPILRKSDNQYFIIALENNINISEINDLTFDGIEYIQPNYINELLAEPDDHYFQNGDQWALKQDNNKDIKATDAWNITVGSREIIVGVVDSGLHFDHPDLQANIFVNQMEI